jgi:ubiquinone/menaquinone biosynthesis C-methylase UbiE
MLTFEQQRAEVQYNLGSKYNRRQLLKNISCQNGRVLDVGSQTGDNVAIFKGCELYGFDLSFTGQAKGIRPEVHMITADATAVPFRSNSFDAIIINHVLEHIPDQYAALREAERLLKPGGTVWLACPTSFSGQLKPGEAEKHKHVRGYTSRSLEIAAAGHFDVRKRYIVGRAMWFYQIWILKFLVQINRVQIKLSSKEKLLWQRAWMIKAVNPILQIFLFPLEDFLSQLPWWPTDLAMVLNTCLVLEKKK